MEKKKRKATKAQRERIGNMLETGHIGRTEAEEILLGLLSNHSVQAIIHRHQEDRRNLPSISELVKPSYFHRFPDPSDAFAFWQAVFPEGGTAIAQVLHRFHDWHLTPLPPCPELNELAKHALPGRKLRGASLVSVLEQDHIQVHRPKKNHFFALSRLKDMLGPRGELLHFALKYAIPMNRRPLYVHNIDIQFNISNMLEQSIVVPAAAALLGDTELVQAFEPLHKLWLAGNLPCGIRRRKLAVVVNDMFE